MQKKKLALAILALGSIPLSGFHQASAAEIEEITVVGGRMEESIPQDLSRYGNQVEVITAEELQRGGYIDATQSLQMLVPGLHIRPKNGQFDYFDASLQGSRNQEILWLIDGVRITNRLYNGTSPLDTVPAHMIERIEVLKGGQGIFYGTQSVGGVVNIVTKSMQQEANGQVSAGVNTNSGYGINGYYGAGNDQFQYLAYASRDQADGYQPWRDADIEASATDRKRGYEVNMAGVKLGFSPDENSLLSMHYQRTENKLDFLRPYLNFKTLNERSEDILTLKYDLQVNDSLGFYVKAYWHNWDTNYTEIFNTLDASGNVTGALRYRNNKDYWGYQDDGINAMAKYTTDYGLEYIAGYDRQQFSGVDAVWRIANLEETVNAYFVQARTTQDMFQNTMLALALRRNNPSNSEAITVWNFSGKHNISDSLYVQANIGSSFRLPDAEQLFLNEIYDEDNDGVPDDFFSVGNANLKPEKSRNINISIGGNVGSLNYELTGFKRKITDYIDSYVSVFIAGVEGESFINTNDEVDIDGIELSASMQFTRTFNGSFSYTNTNAEFNDNGKQLTGIPESEIKLGLGYEAESSPFGLRLTLNHVGDLNERQATTRGNYTVMDLSGHYEFGTKQQHSVVLRIENLADKEYATRVDRGTRDLGGAYLYDNLGMERTLHANYTYNF